MFGQCISNEELIAQLAGLSVPDRARPIPTEHTSNDICKPSGPWDYRNVVGEIHRNCLNKLVRAK